MKFSPSQNDIVNDYLTNLDEGIAPLFIEIRSCVLESAPILNESIKWKDCLVYGTAKNHIQTVLGKGKISLIFFEGALFQDPFGLLEGLGKRTRTFRINSLEFNREALKSYVEQSIA